MMFQHEDLYPVTHLWAEPSRYLVPQRHPEYLLHDTNNIPESAFNDFNLCVGYEYEKHESAHQADRSY